MKFDDIEKTDIKELKAALITCDGIGKEEKEKVLNEICRRMVDMAIRSVFSAMNVKADVTTKQKE